MFWFHPIVTNPGGYGVPVQIVALVAPVGSAFNFWNWYMYPAGPPAGETH